MSVRTIFCVIDYGPKVCTPTKKLIGQVEGSYITSLHRGGANFSVSNQNQTFFVDMETHIA